MFFSLLVIAVSFIPVFTLIDQEGRLFRPLALSKTFTMAVAAFLAITFDPAMRMLFAREKPINSSYPLWNFIVNKFLVGTYYSEERHPVSRRLFKVYNPIVRWTLHHRKTTIIIALFGFMSLYPGFKMLGSEFMPKLHEGSLLYMPTSLPGLSIAEAQNILIKQDRILKTFPEVDTVFGKAGRAETSTDTAPLSMIETTIVLKSQSQWRKQKRWYSRLPDFLKFPFRKIWPETISEEELISEMNRKLNFIGMPNIWTMPIKNRVDMLSTGIRSTLGLKIYGPDLSVIQSIAQNLESEIKKMNGVSSVVAERIAGGYFLDLNIHREKLQAYGLTVKSVQDQITAVVGGVNVSQVLSKRERYPIQVRLAPAFRQDIESIKRLLIVSQTTGAQIPLSAVADVKMTNGPSMIRDENGSLAGYVYIDIDSRIIDVGSFVEKAKNKFLKI